MTRQTSLFDLFQEESPAEKTPEVAAVTESPAQVIEKTSQAEEAPVVEIELVIAPSADEKRETIVAPVALRKSTRGRMKLSDMNAVADLIDVPEDEALFSKRYYPIGVVADMFKVNISLIRFWENEFDILKPKKNGKGDRLFRPEDVKNLKLIYHLLREKKYTIEGARDYFKRHKKAEENFAIIESLKKLKLFLHELKANF